VVVNIQHLGVPVDVFPVDRCTIVELSRDVNFVENQALGPADDPFVGLTIGPTPLETPVPQQW
jgi:hypothetical protein